MIDVWHLYRSGEGGEIVDGKITGKWQDWTAGVKLTVAAEEELSLETTAVIDGGLQWQRLGGQGTAL